MQHAASALSTDSPNLSTPSDVSSSSVGVSSLNIHNCVVNAEKFVDSFLSDG